MKAFAALYEALDSTTRTSVKTAALAAYFRSAPPADAAWAVYFLTGHKPRQAVRSGKLHEWAAAAAGLPAWLFAESYDAVGDLAETIALVLPPPARRSDIALAEWVEARVLPLRDLPEDAQRIALTGYWDELGGFERFVFNKLITGAFRVGVSQLLVIRALAEVSGIDAKIVAHRIAGGFTPSPQAYEQLVAVDAGAFDVSKPYPFFLAHPLAGGPAGLGDVGDWQAEWKWDGIRGQLVKRRGQVFLWSRGEELVTHQFPEIVAAAAPLPDCVLDGEILPFKEGRVQPFAALQKRLGRKAPGKKILEDVPVVFLAYDVLEEGGADLRALPLHERRDRLHRLVCSIPGNTLLQLSEIVRAPSWETLAVAREESRARGTEGLMLKRRDSPYGVGRTATRQEGNRAGGRDANARGGDWWKWKIDPLTVDGVLIYAQRGHGKRASLYTDYTFGIWRNRDDGAGRELVPFAKAYSGLSDEEIAEVDAFIRKNTLEKFGPVRTVRPELVFELAFEGIQRSKRHKSGVAVRFPRMARIRRDKRIEDADSIETIEALLGER